MIRVAVLACLFAILLPHGGPRQGSSPLLLAQAKPEEQPIQPPAILVPGDVERALFQMESGHRDDARRQLAAAFTAHSNDFWGGRVQFVLGYMDIEDKRFESALGHLREPSILKSGFEDLSIFYQGHAYLNLKDYEIAAEAFQFYMTARGESALTAEAAKMLGEALAAAGRPAEAAAAYEKSLAATKGWEVPSLYFKAGESHEKAAELKQALACFETLYARFPTYYRDRDVQNRMRSLHLALKLPSLIAPELVEERARSFADAGHHKSAYGEYSRLKASYPAHYAARGLAHEYGVEAFKSGNHTLAKSLLTEAAGRDVTGRSQLALADLLRETGKDPTPSLEAASHGDAAYAEPALYKLFSWYHARRDGAGATRHMQDLVTRFPGTLAGLALWKRAWSRYADGAFEEAGVLFARYRDVSPRGDYAAASMYWASRAFERCGRAAEAGKISKELAVRFPRTIYANFPSSQPTGHPDPPPSDVAAERSAYFQAARSLLPPDVQVAWDRAELLRLCRLHSLALRELRYIESNTTDRTAVRVKEAVIYHDTRSHRQAIITIRDTFPAYVSMRPGDLPRFVWEMLYPLRYTDQFEKQAARLGIPTSLLLGLVCQESCFNPVARSGSGAVGVMQLLPSTARYVARKHHLRYSSASLLDPEANIEMGALYLDGLLTQFGQNHVYALIGYNAGPGRVLTWRRSMPGFSGLEIAENAGFAETRNYVLVVLQNAREYERLYGLTTTGG